MPEYFMKQGTSNKDSNNYSVNFVLNFKMRQLTVHWICFFVKVKGRLLFFQQKRILLFGMSIWGGLNTKKIKHDCRANIKHDEESLILLVVQVNLIKKKTQKGSLISTLI